MLRRHLETTRLFRLLRTHRGRNDRSGNLPIRSASPEARLYHPHMRGDDEATGVNPAPSDPTESADLSVAQTESVLAWADDYAEDSEATRLTSRRITAMAVIASVTVILAAAIVVFFVTRDGNHQAASPPSPSVSAQNNVPAAPMLNGTYRIDTDWANTMLQQSPRANSAPPRVVTSEWWQFSSSCAPSGCTAVGKLMMSDNHDLPDASGRTATLKWFADQGVWGEDPPWNIRSDCNFVDANGQVVRGVNTVAQILAFQRSPNGTWLGFLTQGVTSNECGFLGDKSQTPLSMVPAD